MWGEVGCVEKGERGPVVGVGTEGALPHFRCKEIELCPTTTTTDTHTPLL